jgi:hypothetical protein
MRLKAFLSFAALKSQKKLSKALLFSVAVHADSHYHNVLNTLLHAHQALSEHSYVANWLPALLASHWLSIAHFLSQERISSLFL